MFGRSAHLEDQIAQLRARIDQQDALLRRLADQIGTDLPALQAAAREDAMPAAVREAVDRGQTILAIKEYRAATGTGLAEAKRAVEAYAASRGR